MLTLLNFAIDIANVIDALIAAIWNLKQGHGSL